MLPSPAAAEGGPSHSRAGLVCEKQRVFGELQSSHHLYTCIYTSRWKASKGSSLSIPIIFPRPSQQLELGARGTEDFLQILYLA